MIPAKLLKKYTKKSDYTYTLGTFPTFELLQNHPEHLEEVIVGSQVKEEIREKLERACGQRGIPILENDRALERVRNKEACIVAGVLQKYEDCLEEKSGHVVLVNPGDMGNLGTILRTCAGFGVRNVAVIEPAADLFHPKTLRSSMGALFSVHWERFAYYEAYRDRYGEGRDQYPFMLKGAAALHQLQRQEGRPWSLIFGNEASGLADSFLDVGQTVLIQHTGLIDSLNLSMAVGIALYEFTKGEI